jgi:hypothetical protein
MNIENYFHAEFNNTIARDIWIPIWVNIGDKTKDKARENCWNFFSNNVSDVENILAFTFDEINEYEF